MFLIIFLFPALYGYFHVCQNQLFKRLTRVTFYLLKPVCSQELLAVLLIHSSPIYLCSKQYPAWNSVGARRPL